MAGFAEYEELGLGNQRNYRRLGQEVIPNLGWLGLFHFLKEDAECSSGDHDFDHERGKGQAYHDDGREKGDIGDALSFREDGDHGNDTEKKTQGTEELHPAYEDKTRTKIADLNNGGRLVFFEPISLKHTH